VTDRRQAAAAGANASAPVDRIVATYRVRCEAGGIEARARALALEQSIEMPLEAVGDSFVRDEVVARVESIEPARGSEAADRQFEVRLSLSLQSTGLEAGQLLNMLFGNCSLQPDIELVDMVPSATLLASMPGPRFGADGWRTALRLDPADGPRALTCTALKPQGLSPERLAELAAVFARSGIDVIKDDHGIADLGYAPFARRVPAVPRAVERAAAMREGSGRALYAPTLSGGPRRLAEQLRIVRDEGVGAVLVCPMIAGVPALVEQVRAEAGVPIIAHPAMAGSLRISPALLLGRLFRLFGADATIFPNYGGRFSYDRATCRAIAQRALEPIDGFKATLPVPAGGMSVERVEEMLREFGTDVMLLIGGNLLMATAVQGDSVADRARAFVRRVQVAARAADREAARRLSQPLRERT
jgi:ribulose-bisphosphate carboxylase large chain